MPNYLEEVAEILLEHSGLCAPNSVRQVRHKRIRHAVEEITKALTFNITRWRLVKGLEDFDKTQETQEPYITGMIQEADTPNKNNTICTQEALENAAKEWNEKNPDSDTKYSMKDGSLWATIKAEQDKEFVKKVTGQGPSWTMTARYNTKDVKSSLAIVRMDLKQAIDDQGTLRERLESILVFVTKAEESLSDKR
jgi:hypothetical protein